MPLLLASPAFAPGGQIPTEYTCDGADISPPFSWAGVPPGTKRLVLVVEDPDAPSGVLRHWAAFGIPPNAGGLAAGYGRNRPAARFREARNDFGDEDYGGPARREATRRIITIFACSRSAGRCSIRHRPPAPPTYCRQPSPTSSKRPS